MKETAATRKAPIGDSMKVLVTGATGFLGSWLTRRLVEEGHDVRILRRKSSDLSELDGLTVEHGIGDVSDPESTLKACQGVEAVFHLAGVVGYSKAMRDLMEKVNVQGTRNVVEACKAQSVQRLIHLSSVTAVGASFDGKLLNENSTYNVRHLNLGYFETKRAAEEIVKRSADAGELDAVMLNPSTIYGPGDAKKGSRKVQMKVAQGRFPFYTSGGVSIVAVEDIVEAIVAAHSKGRSGERYILSGENITIKQLFEWIAEAAGAKAPRIFLPNPVVKLIGKVGDKMEAAGKKGPLNTENAWTSILYHWFDSTKAREELGFQPRPAKIAIQNSVNWMKENSLI